MGIDIEALFEDALRRESEIQDSADIDQQALDNLAFLDRMRQLTASFKDTHFGIGGLHTVSPVSLGFFVAEADGKFVISGRVPKMLAMATLVADDERVAQISMGDELLAIDGEKPQAAINALLPYISASSPAFGQMRATWALSSRSFRFPGSSHATIRLRKASGEELTFKLPWMHRQITRADQARLFKRIGIQNSMMLRYSWDEVKQRWNIIDLPVDLYDPGISLVGLKDSKSYVHPASPERLVIRTGYLLREGRSTGVLQLFSFATENVLHGEKSLAFLTVIEDFVSELKANGSPLIMDLRNNGGGIGSYPSKVMAMLAPEGVTYAGRSFAYRVTPFMRQIMDSSDEESSPMAEVLEGMDWDTYLWLMKDAVNRAAPVTHAGNEKDIKVSAKVGGYSGKIVALISPECISACDNMAMHLDHTQRATLIGSPTNGTGAGFMSTAAFSPEWRDPYQVLRARIPNYLFGRPGGAPGERIFENRAAELNMENRPTVPSQTYAPTLRDVTKGDQDWIEAALKALN